MHECTWRHTRWTFMHNYYAVGLLSVFGSTLLYFIAQYTVRIDISALSFTLVRLASLFVMITKKIITMPNTVNILQPLPIDDWILNGNGDNQAENEERNHFYVWNWINFIEINTYVVNKIESLIYVHVATIIFISSLY